MHRKQEIVLLKIRFPLFKDFLFEIADVGIDKLKGIHIIAGVDMGFYVFDNIINRFVLDFYKQSKEYNTD